MLALRGSTEDYHFKLMKHWSLFVMGQIFFSLAWDCKRRGLVFLTSTMHAGVHETPFSLPLSCLPASIEPTAPVIYLFLHRKVIYQENRVQQAAKGDKSGLTFVWTWIISKRAHIRISQMPVLTFLRGSGSWVVLTAMTALYITTEDIDIILRFFGRCINRHQRPPESCNSVRTRRIGCTFI